MPAVATFAIPCRNGAAHLAPLLRSLLAQTRQDFDLLLVDDASTDGSVALARDLAGDRLQVLRNDPPLGLGGNFAFAAARVATPYFCLAHQDDVYAPDYLERLLAALAAAPAAAFAHCPALAIDDRGHPLLAAAERYKRGLAAQAVAADRAGLYALLWRGNFVCCPSVLFRTAAYRAVGGFRAQLSFAIDWELWFRVLRQGQRFVTVAAPLVHYRRHAGNATRAATRALSRFIEEGEVLAEARRLGIAAGLLPASVGPSPSLRNNLVNEAFEDLRAGAPAAAAQKLAFVRERLPELWWDPYVVALRTGARLGAPGRWLLGAGRRAAVALGLGT